jgi:tRNA pseudouridine38-40 synthase
MNRYFLELSYRGSAYHGWQIQPNGITVQEVLEDALFKALREEIQVTGAGRTDTGVHATYFVAHFDTPQLITDPDSTILKFNRILPNDIVVHSLQPVDSNTHSRFSATSRKYEYHVTLLKDPFRIGMSTRVHHQLDFEAMNKACRLLFEYSDFTSFSKLHTDTRTNDCIIKQACWERHNNLWIFTIEADRFLRNMVRAIVGTLFEVGRGKMTLNEFRQVIEAKDRGKAGASVPAEALYLVDIKYPDELFQPFYRP